MSGFLILLIILNLACVGWDAYLLAVHKKPIYAGLMVINLLAAFFCAISLAKM